jgi:hypothetical protein
LIAVIAALVLTDTAAAEVSVNDAEWMSGCWKFDGGQPGSGEYWTPPAGGSLFGISRTVRDGRTTAFEFMRIVETEDDDLILIASPAGQATTTFVLESLSDDEIIFTNPDHDFPQRVGYRRLPGPRLLGWIDGSINGQSRRIEFPMAAVDCDLQAERE